MLVYCRSLYLLKQENGGPTVNARYTITIDPKLMIWSLGASEYFKRTENIAGVKVRATDTHKLHERDANHFRT